ncbi:hypothetical protein ACH4OX_36085 [Streptomyces roseolus]|uniref:hypothetical protein n=1 Tax=Streptomyces roseolus TaxID=67358 RepID=UPI0037B03C52
MSVPVQQPASSPAPSSPPPGPNGRWMLGGTVLGGGGMTTALVFVGALWWVVAMVAVMALLATFGIMVLPEQSEHKRDIWLEGMRYRDRREERALRKREKRAQRKREEREERAAEAEAACYTPTAQGPSRRQQRIEAQGARARRPPVD